jgi:predicted TPR repeat methyltransferase
VNETPTSEYDRQSQEHNWLSPDVLFGLSYEFTRAGQSLLDIGIGTGLSSILFHKAGLLIYGVDGSSEMLEQCAGRALARELRQWDLHESPLPYSPKSFDHVIANGVFHLFGDLEPIFDEVARITKPLGTFGFTIEEQKTGSRDDYVRSKQPGVYEKLVKETGTKHYRHSRAYIARLLDRNGFAPLKQLEFLAFTDPDEQRNVYFWAYVAQKRAA